MTSAQAAATMLVGLIGVGGRVLRRRRRRAARRRRGGRPGQRADATTRCRRPQAVIQGFSPDLRYEDLAQADARRRRRRDLGRDQHRHHAADRAWSAAGQRHAGRGGRGRHRSTPVVAGKPERALVDEAVRRMRRPPPAVRGRPARHRHRGCGPRRPRLPARPHRGQHAGRPAGRRSAERGPPTSRPTSPPWPRHPYHCLFWPSASGARPCRAGPPRSRASRLVAAARGGRPPMQTSWDAVPHPGRRGLVDGRCWAAADPGRCCARRPRRADRCRPARVAVYRPRGGTMALEDPRG